MLASINPSLASESRMTLQLSQAVRKVLDLRFPTAPVWRSTYVGLEELFVRLARHEHGDQVLLEAWTDVRSVLLLEHGTEALRLLRASTMVAAAALSPRLREKMSVDLESMHAAEKSHAVRARLDLAK
nr:hypothetical protein CFP56_71037 [Quercus suber]